MFHLWLVFRFLTSGRRLLNLPSMMSLAGMALGVASLTVAMGVVSGFETSLKTAITDVYGHVMVVRRGDRSQDLEQIIERIKEVVPETEAYTPFVSFEGVIAGNGKLAGVVIQGIEEETVDDVLNIKNRVINGAFTLKGGGDPPVALVGKALAKRFELEVGKTFKVVLPAPSRSDSTEFVPRIQTFVVGGVLDLGKVEYDERIIMTDVKSAQRFADIGENFTGVRLKLSDPNHSVKAAGLIADRLGPQYWAVDWKEVNRNLLEAIELEKPVIFFVILVMVVAASFNISSNLFVSVLQKYGDVSILRALGFSSRDVRRMFIYQGLFFGVLGTVVGLVLGLLLSLAFIVLQEFFVLLPVETYRIDHVGVELRIRDVLVIVGASLLICLVSTLVPANRGAKLDPVEGLRYE